MIGKFKVLDIDVTTDGVACVGETVFGLLKPGMEALNQGTIFTIKTIRSANGKRVRKTILMGQGAKLYLDPQNLQLAQSMKEEVIEFSDEKTIPLKKRFFLSTEAG